jgi:hypothetical protein
MLADVVLPPHAALPQGSASPCFFQPGTRRLHHVRAEAVGGRYFTSLRSAAVGGSAGGRSQER